MIIRDASNENTVRVEDNCFLVKDLEKFIDHLCIIGGDPEGYIHLMDKDTGAKFAMKKLK